MSFFKWVEISGGEKGSNEMMSLGQDEFFGKKCRSPVEVLYLKEMQVRQVRLLIVSEIELLVGAKT